MNPEQPEVLLSNQQQLERAIEQLLGLGPSRQSGGIESVYETARGTFRESETSLWSGPEVNRQSGQSGQSDRNGRDAWITGTLLVLAAASLGTNIYETVKSPSVGSAVSGFGDLGNAAITSAAFWKSVRASRTILLVYAALLAGASEVVALTERLAGFGAPVTGAGLGASAQRVCSVGEALGGADPVSSGWSGSAAHGYAGSNAALQDLVVAAADLDERLAAIVTRQAGQAEQVRVGLAGVKSVLASGAVICGVWAAAAQADPTATTTATFVKILSAVGFCAFASVAGLVATGIDRGRDNGREAAEIQRDYEALAGAASIVISRAPMSRRG